MNQIIKNTIILFVITLVAGICLGTVHDITLDPIAQAQEAAATKTYQEVYPDAASFDEPQELADAVTAAADSISEWGFGKVTINDAKEALDASGNQIGYLITSTSAESYGVNVPDRSWYHQRGRADRYRFLKHQRYARSWYESQRTGFQGSVYRQES